MTTDLAAYFQNLKGKEEVSDWITLTQAMIDDFATLTGDRQWIHVDPERAARESPFGTTIAHGFLVLSLVGRFFEPQEPGVPARNVINYGADNLRFPAPARVGCRLRGRRELKDVGRLPGGGARLVTRITIESDSEEKPCCVFDSIVLYFA